MNAVNQASFISEPQKEKATDRRIINALIVGLAFLVLPVIVFAVVAGQAFSAGLPQIPDAEALDHYSRATQFFETGNLERAISEYQEAISLMPNYAIAHNDLGVVYQLLGQYAEAKSELEKAIEAKPDLAMAHANLANVYDDLGQFDQGLIEVNEALRLDPSLSFAHLVSGYLNFNIGNLPAAKAAFEETIDLDPSMSDAFFMLGLMDFDDNNWNLAIDKFNQALDTNVPPEGRSSILGFRALAYAVTLDLDSAMDDLEEAINLNVTNAFAFYVRGLVYMELGETESAIADFEETLRLDLDPEFRPGVEAFLEELGR